jgi:hypothetical protein
MVVRKLFPNFFQTEQPVTNRLQALFGLVPDAPTIPLAVLEKVHDTAALLGPEWYGVFVQQPIRLTTERDASGEVLVINPLNVRRSFITEGTRLVNQRRGNFYQNNWCTKPGFDWRFEDGEWLHPAARGESGNWEMLPVPFTNPADDLAEMVMFYVDLVERNFAAKRLSVTAPTRFVFVRDAFLRLPVDHVWYANLTPQAEQQAAENLAEFV